MTTEQVQKKIEECLPGSQAFVEDLTGTQNHYKATVICSAFAGKKMIDQHRLVKSFFDSDIQSGEVHALSLKTFTPQEWEKRGATL